MSDLLYKTIREWWEYYSRETLPPRSSIHSLQHRAFYTGAAIAAGMILSLMEEKDDESLLNLLKDLSSFADFLSKKE